MPNPRTTELPFAVARLVILGAGREATWVGASSDSAMAVAGGAAGDAGAGGGEVWGRTTASDSLTAATPFFFAGFSPFPGRGATAAGKGPFANVSFTSATSASDMNGF